MMNKFIHFIKALMASFKKNNTTLLGAAQAYHYLLMIVPLLIVSFAIIPYLNLNPDDVLKFIGEMIPEELASIFESTIIHLVETPRSEEHTSELQSRFDLVCRLLLEKKNSEQNI